MLHSSGAYMLCSSGVPLRLVRFAVDGEKFNGVQVAAINGAMQTAEVAALRSAVQRWLLVAVKHVNVLEQCRKRFCSGGGVGCSERCNLH